MRAQRAEIGIIGGSGFYSFHDDAEAVVVDTPFGPPSSTPMVATVGGRAVAFLARHGSDHRFPPHRVPYRANLWAMAALGVRQILAPCAVGSLRADYGPGTLVVPDQLVDRTSGRVQTFYDSGAVHVGFADPYCPVGRAAMVAESTDRGVAAVDGGTMVVVEGPRFSSRAESRWFAAQGWAVVNMTGHPEAVLARELGLCYSAAALVTDFDAGVSASDAAVTQEEVFRVFAENTGRLRTLLAGVVPRLPVDRVCPCAQALHGIGGDPLAALGLPG